MKAQTTLIKKILLLFLRKLPKIYCIVQKRNTKFYVHLFRNELSYKLISACKKSYQHNNPFMNVN